MHWFNEDLAVCVWFASAVIFMCNNIPFGVTPKRTLFSKKAQFMFAISYFSKALYYMNKDCTSAEAIRAVSLAVISLLMLTILLIYYKRDDCEKDIERWYELVIMAFLAGLIAFLSSDKYPFFITFGCVFEAVAIVPQLCLISNVSGDVHEVDYYILFLMAYKLIEIIVTASTPSHNRAIVNSGIVQVMIYMDYLVE